MNAYGLKPGPQQKFWFQFSIDSPITHQKIKNRLKTRLKAIIVLLLGV
jgi:hypothetical protein